MNSLECYLWYKKQYCDGSYAPKCQKLGAIDNLIKQIYKEIMKSSLKLDDSPFIVEVEKILEFVTLEQTISIPDAYAVIEGLAAYIKDSAFTVTTFDFEFPLHLFTDFIPEENCIMNYIRRIDNCLKFLRTELPKIKNICSTPKSNLSEIEKVRTVQPPNNLIEKRNTSVTTETQTFQQPNNFAEKKRDSDTTEAQTYQQSNNLFEKRNTSATAETQVFQQLNAPIKRENTSDTIEEQRLKNQEKRIEQNRIHVQLWHDEQAGISAKLIEMQPLVKQMLENLMSFSNNITDSYVLQLANMQIELFNQIFDAHIYHEKNLSVCKDKDYINAVLNYGNFMESIVDNLAVFGIEEIVSDSGTLFDGAIHATNTDSFSPKTAIIAKSVRPGFKYKDIIIQKEKVLL